MVRQRNLTPIYAGSNPARVVCNKWLHITLRRMNNMDDNKKGITVEREGTVVVKRVREEKAKDVI